MPNLLSLARVPLGVAVWLAPTNALWVFSLLVLAGVSDMLDGYFARRAGGTAESFGAWLDPVCDKAFVASTMAALWVSVVPPWWLGALVLVREGVVLVLVSAKWLDPDLRHRSLPTRSLLLGKATTCAQFLVFLVVLLDARAWWLPSGLLAGGLGLLAGGQYTLRALRAIRALREAPRGPTAKSMHLVS